MDNQCLVFNEKLHTMLKLITQVRFFSNERRLQKLKLAEKDRYTDMLKDLIEGMVLLTNKISFLYFRNFLKAELNHVVGELQTLNDCLAFYKDMKTNFLMAFKSNPDKYKQK